MSILKTYLQYGVSQEIAEQLAKRKLPVTTFRNTSVENLKDKYGLAQDVIEIVKNCVVREPIDESVMDSLLERSNYTCCVCKGTKGKTYIIHHIKEYSRSQDNNYSNLAVLCPSCHDIAHRNSGLTNRLSTDELLRLKDKWEKQVEKQNAEAAARSGKITDTDYVNIHRILELAISALGEIPSTNVAEGLVRDGLLLPTGELCNNSALLDLGFNASRISHHFHQIFQNIVSRINFENLDELLSKPAILKPEFIGTFCFYIGGLYGQTPPQLSKSHENQIIRLFMHRRAFYCEWLLDSRFVTSRTALSRFSEHSVYIVYGRIKSVANMTLMVRSTSS